MRIYLRIHFILSNDTNIPFNAIHRGHYGAFLMDDWPTISHIVSTLTANLRIPVTCKIRIFPTFSKTLAYAKMLEAAGCSLLSVHGRELNQKEEVLSDWAVVQGIRKALTIPVVANGDFWHSEDVRACRQLTGCAGYMSAQGLLHNPAMFQPLLEQDKKKKNVKTDEQVNADGANGDGDDNNCEHNNNDTETHLSVDGDTYDDAKGVKVISSTSQIYEELEALPPYMRLRRTIGATTSYTLSFSFDPSQRTSQSASSSSSSFSSSFYSTSDDVYRQFKLAREYIDKCQLYPPSHPSIIQRHIFFILFDSFQANTDVYELLHTAEDLPTLAKLIDVLFSRAESGRLHRGKEKDKKKYTLRRDGTLAPPPWPVGGGNMGVCNVDKKVSITGRTGQSCSSFTSVTPPAAVTAVDTTKTGINSSVAKSKHRTEHEDGSSNISIDSNNLVGDSNAREGKETKIKKTKKLTAKQRKRQRRGREESQTQLQPTSVLVSNLVTGDTMSGEEDGESQPLKRSKVNAFTSDSTDAASETKEKRKNKNTKSIANIMRRRKMNTMSNRPILLSRDTLVRANSAVHNAHHRRMGPGGNRDLEHKDDGGNGISKASDANSERRKSTGNEQMSIGEMSRLKQEQRNRNGKNSKGKKKKKKKNDEIDDEEADYLAVMNGLNSISSQNNADFNMYEDNKRRKGGKKKRTLMDRFTGNMDLSGSGFSSMW